MRRALSLLLIPLSALPIIAVVPTVMSSHARFKRVYEMGPLPAPQVALSAAENARFRPFAAPRGRVPVLVWHGIDPRRDGYSTSARSFARQLALLRHLGYTALSMRQWVSFRQGHGALPRKPILLTFDDGRLDSYRGADRVLAREHMRAAMFVITGQIDRRNPFYLSWQELHRMHDSGRWDIEPHAHDGHTQVTMSASGRRAPFYAARRYTRSHGLESLAAWEARVDTDLFTLERRFAQHGFRPDAFAVPYSDYGQGVTNDPAIAGLLGGLLTRQFGSYFLQADDGHAAFSAPGVGAVDRYELRTGTSLDDLYGWLRRHSQSSTRR